MSKIIGKLLHIAQSLCTHLESLRYFDSVKTTIAKLAEWEKRFYAVQQDALKHMPKALAELDARLAKILAQTAPKEVHTVATGVEADKTLATLPAKQRIRDTPGKVLPKTDVKSPASVPKAKSNAKSKAKAKTKPKAPPDPPPKDSPDPVKSVDPGVNTKKAAVADAAAAADKARITELSNEASEALKKGDKTLAKAKIDEARSILNPHLPKKPSDTWDEFVKRLDVSSPKDAAVFWSGDAALAQKYADSIGGVTLETTAGGRIIDTTKYADRHFPWPEMEKYVWDDSSGALGPYAKDLWGAASEKYGEGVSGKVSVVQTPGKLWDPRTIWHNDEKPLVKEGLLTERIDAIDMFTIDKKGSFISLGENQKAALFELKGTKAPYPEVPRSYW